MQQLKVAAVKVCQSISGEETEFGDVQGLQAVIDFQRFLFKN